MHAGVDDEADRAPHFVGQLAEVVVGIIIEAHVEAELLRVEAPAFAVGDEIGRSAEHRRLRQFECARELEVMARYGFVQAQRHHFPGRTHLGLVQVHVVVAGAAAIGGAGLVIGRGRIRRDVVRDRAHAIGQARNRVEHLDQFGIDAFGRGPVAFEQRRRRLLEELRIAAQVGEELGQAALETGFVLDALHLCLDPGDFAEPDLVDPRRTEIGRRVVAGEEVVIGLAIGQVARRDRSTRVRQVVLIEEAGEFPVRRNDLVGDDAASFSAQGLAFRFGDAVGELEKRPVVGAAGRVVDDLGGNLRGHSFHQHFRRHVLPADAFAHQQRGLVDQLRQPFQACDPVAVVLAAGEGQHFGDAISGLHAALVADRLQVLVEFLAFDRLLQLPLERIVVELVGGREGRAIDRMQARQRSAVRSFTRLNRLHAEVGPAIVEARIAVVAGIFGRFGQPAFPFAVEQGVQGRACRSAWGCRLVGAQRGNKGQHRCRQTGNPSVHEQAPRKFRLSLAGLDLAWSCSGRARGSRPQRDDDVADGAVRHARYQKSTNDGLSARIGVGHP